MEMHAVLAALSQAQKAIDVLAQDAEEAGYPARAEEATDLAMRLRAILREAGYRASEAT